MVVLAGRAGRSRLLRGLAAPAVVLPAGLLVIALVVHRSWLGLDLTGGRVAPLPGLGEVWSSYLAEWHPVGNGTAAPAPASLAVAGLLGLLCYPFGGPAAAVSLLLICSIPLAGLTAYLAGRHFGVPRWHLALVAAAYALLPVGVQAAVQGRLDGVVAHVLLPAVLSGVVGVLSGRSVGRGGPRGWLPAACGTALGLALVSAFAPVLHLVVLAVVLAGFVVVPGPPGRGWRRAVALFAVVLLPLGLLLPWPVVVLQHPQVLLHGAGAVVPESGLPPLRMAGFDAGGPGPPGWLGPPLTAAVIAVLVRVLAAVLAGRWRVGLAGPAGPAPRAGLAGLALAVAGFAGAFAVSTVTAVPLAGGEPRPGWPGPALLVAACGLLWAVLASHPRAPARRVQVLATGAAGLVVAALAAGASLTAGALTGDRPALAEATQGEVTTDATGVLVVGAAGEPVRSAVARLPAFGDDDLAPVPAGPARLARWSAAFASGQPGVTRPAVLEAAVSGIEFVVLPDRASADVLLRGGAGLVAAAPPGSDGRPVVRLLPPVAPVVVLPAELAAVARTGGAPPDDYASRGVADIEAAPPAAGAMVGAGTPGRLLVVAAEDEPGWTATVDGAAAEVSRAWGHLVAVVLPAEAAQVRVERSGTTRMLLLLAQVAVALFTAVAAIPARGQAGGGQTSRGQAGGGEPSTTSGSRPR